MVIMNQKTKKYKTLSFLAQGRSQCWIERKGKLFKGKNAASIISRYTKEFLDEGWIEPTGCKYPKIYRATPIAPLRATGGKGKPLRTHQITRVHQTRWSMDVLSEMKREITWDKKRKINNNVYNFYLYFPSVTIQFTPTKVGFGTVVIFPHERYLDEVQMEHHLDIVKEDMRVARAWLQRVLLCRLSVPVEIIDRHFAKPIMNPEVMRVLKKSGSIRVDDCWIDASKMGFKYGEIESTDPAKLQAMKMLEWGDQQIPQRVSQLEAEISSVTSALETFSDKMDTFLNPPKQLSPKDLVMYG